MATIKIDDKEYDLDQMSDAAKAQLVSIQFCEQELQRLQAQAAAIQTARMAYVRSLKESLEAKSPAPPFALSGETIKFS